MVVSCTNDYCRVEVMGELCKILIMNIDHLPKEYIDSLRENLDPKSFKLEMMDKSEDLKYRYADGPDGAYITHVIYPNGDVVPYCKPS